MSNDSGGYKPDDYRRGGDPLKHQDWRDHGNWKHGGDWNPKKHEEESINRFDYKKRDWDKKGR